MVATVDYAFLDGTFHDGAELGHRDMAEVPHPFIVESLALMADWPAEERNKVHFIHLNHTNPLLQADSEESRNVAAAGVPRGPIRRPDSALTVCPAGRGGAPKRQHLG